jgi:hypothetical protein
MMHLQFSIVTMHFAVEAEIVIAPIAGVILCKH